MQNQALNQDLPADQDRTASMAIAALSALAQEHRLAAFRLLVQAGPAGMAAGAIAGVLAMPASSLSFHLAHMERAGLVTRDRNGRSLIYAANFATMTGLIAYLTENCCGVANACAPQISCPTSERTVA